MFALTATRSGSPRRLRERNVFALSILFCLSVALFAGCKMDDNDIAYPPAYTAPFTGTWTSEYNDSYILTDTTLTYDDGYDSVPYAGAIVYVSKFSGDAGVIIIKYDERKPTYYDSSENYGNPDHAIPLKGDYIGVYYKKLKPGVSVEMGGAYKADGAEEATLAAAQKVFTEGNEGSFMSLYGTYVKK